MRNSIITTLEESPIESVARALIYIYNNPEDREAALQRFVQAYEKQTD